MSAYNHYCTTATVLMHRCAACREIYDWDDDTGLQGVGGGGLAGKLDESLDAFNDDTFGLPEEAAVGKCQTR